MKTNLISSKTYLGASLVLAAVLVWTIAGFGMGWPELLLVTCLAAVGVFLIVSNRNGARPNV